ncbi:unnamed protein product [Amoebophrya sp. A25]|nr:unnamed protein product [Amoebophrya sp. A25]|eukprot:GSA25T00022561001.1
MRLAFDRWRMQARERRILRLTRGDVAEARTAMLNTFRRTDDDPRESPSHAEQRSASTSTSGRLNGASRRAQTQETAGPTILTRTSGGFLNIGNKSVNLNASSGPLLSQARASPPLSATGDRSRILPGGSRLLGTSTGPFAPSARSGSSVPGRSSVPDFDASPTTGLAGRLRAARDGGISRSGEFSAASSLNLSGLRDSRDSDLWSPRALRRSRILAEQENGGKSSSSGSSVRHSKESVPFLSSAAGATTSGSVLRTASASGRFQLPKFDGFSLQVKKIQAPSLSPLPSMLPEKAKS